MPFLVKLENVERVYQYLIEKGQELKLLDQQGAVNAVVQSDDSKQDAAKYSQALFDCDFELFTLEREVAAVSKKEVIRKSLRATQCAAELYAITDQVREKVEKFERLTNLAQIAENYKFIIEKFAVIRQHALVVQRKLDPKAFAERFNPDARAVRQQILEIYEVEEGSRPRINPGSSSDKQVQQQLAEEKDKEPKTTVSYHPDDFFAAVNHRKNQLVGGIQDNIVYEFFKNSPLAQRFVSNLMLQFIRLKASKPYKTVAFDDSNLVRIRPIPDNETNKADHEISEREEKEERRVEQARAAAKRAQQVREQARIAAEKRAPYIRWACYILLGIAFTVAAVLTAGAVVGVAAAFAAVVGGASVGGGAAVTVASGVALPFLLRWGRRLLSAIFGNGESANQVSTIAAVPGESKPEVPLAEMTHRQVSAQMQQNMQPSPARPAAPERHLPQERRPVAGPITMPVGGGVFLIMPYSVNSAAVDQPKQDVQQPGSTVPRKP